MGIILHIRDFFIMEIGFFEDFILFLIILKQILFRFIEFCYKNLKNCRLKGFTNRINGQAT